MTKKLSLSNLPVKGCHVLMRVDFNVPIDKRGVITDDTRIVQSLPSIKNILERGGSLILMSHLGRPKGKVEAAYSLAPCAALLSQLLSKPVMMAPDCIGPKVRDTAAQLKPGEVMMLENLRFYPAEEEPVKDPSFAKELASLADCYVDDAFGSAHRSHSSIVDVASYFPGKSAAGFLMEKEIKVLGEMLHAPKRPFYALLGGAKVSTKIEPLQALLSVVDGLLIGGGMAYTFLKAKGIAIGNSLVEPTYLEAAKAIMETCQKKNIPYWLSEDALIAQSFSNDAATQTCLLAQGIPDGWQGMDIGPKTILKFTEVLKQAATILWNGPLGVFEFPNFSQGTYAIANALADMDAVTIVGGGDSLAAIEAAGVSSKISHLSTGGGATLEFIQYGTLPGIEALSDFPVKK